MEVYFPFLFFFGLLNFISSFLHPLAGFGEDIFLFLLLLSTFTTFPSLYPYFFVENQRLDSSNSLQEHVNNLIVFIYLRGAFVAPIAFFLDYNSFFFSHELALWSCIPSIFCTIVGTFLFFSALVNDNCEKNVAKEVISSSSSIKCVCVFFTFLFLMFVPIFLKKNNNKISELIRMFKNSYNGNLTEVVIGPVFEEDAKISNSNNSKLNKPKSSLEDGAEVVVLSDKVMRNSNNDTRSQASNEKKYILLKSQSKATLPEKSNNDNCSGYDKKRNDVDADDDDDGGNNVVSRMAIPKKNEKIKMKIKIICALLSSVAAFTGSLSGLSSPMLLYYFFIFIFFFEILSPVAHVTLLLPDAINSNIRLFLLLLLVLPEQYNNNNVKKPTVLLLFSSLYSLLIVAVGVFGAALGRVLGATEGKKLGPFTQFLSVILFLLLLLFIISLDYANNNYYSFWVFFSMIITGSAFCGLVYAERVPLKDYLSYLFNKNGNNDNVQVHNKNARCNILDESAFVMMNSEKREVADTLSSARNKDSNNNNKTNRRQRLILVAKHIDWGDGRGVSSVPSSRTNKNTAKIINNNTNTSAEQWSSIRERRESEFFDAVEDDNENTEADGEANPKKNCFYYLKNNNNNSGSQNNNNNNNNDNESMEDVYSLYSVSSMPSFGDGDELITTPSIRAQQENPTTPNNTKALNNPLSENSNNDNTDEKIHGYSFSPLSIDRLQHVTADNIQPGGKIKTNGVVIYDTWDFLSLDNSNDVLSSGDVFFRFLCGKMPEFSDDTKEMINVLNNISCFSDEEVQNNVPKIRMQLNEASNTTVDDPNNEYLGIIVKTMYVIGGIDKNYINKNRIASLDYQKSCQPGPPVFYETADEDLIRFKKTVIKYIFFLIIQFKISEVSVQTIYDSRRKDLKENNDSNNHSSKANPFLYVDGLLPDKIILLERTKNDPLKTDATIKVKSFLLYYNLYNNKNNNKGVLVSNISIVVLSAQKVPSLFGRIVQYFGSNGVVEAVETAVRTREYWKKLKDEERQ